MSDASKTTLLEALRQEMEADTTLPLQPANLVFGEGDPEANVMFIGEAPGLNEDQQKRPFVGRAGQLLEVELKKIDWPRASVYITNIVKRRPPENRDPLPEEIQAYRPYLRRQIQTINPDFIVTLGRFAMNYFLPDAKITRDQGQAFPLRGKLIIPLLHPAAALRSTGMMTMFQASIQNLPKLIAMPRT